MGIANDLASLDATAQAELIRTGEASAVELVEAAIEGAQRVNPQINAIIHPRYDAARAEAAASAGANGPFAGVPMVVKDLGCMMKGEPYHHQFNVTGQPAISLPMYWTADGLPVGVQLVAGFGREDVLVRIAAQLEAAQPWASRRPPVSA
ncbi:MAG TPA: amidase family protein [Ilumatobacteraceae bacterium]|nr:amidase family protein [Ilumatobacteraceae bacterium]